MVAGWDGCPLAMTGLPAASAAAKSPPAIPLNANGKLFGPMTSTGPIAACTARMPAFVSIVGSAQEPSRQAAAACLSCPVVRGSSTSFNRGDTGRPVSRAASAASSSAWASIAAAYSSRNLAISSRGTVASRALAASAAASARSHSARSLTGNRSASGRPVAGSIAVNVSPPVDAVHRPSIHTCAVATVVTSSRRHHDAREERSCHDTGRHQRASTPRLAPWRKIPPLSLMRDPLSAKRPKSYCVGARAALVSQ